MSVYATWVGIYLYIHDCNLYDDILYLSDRWQPKEIPLTFLCFFFLSYRGLFN